MIGSGQACDFISKNLNKQKIIVRAKKYDGSLNRSWECDFVSQTESHLILKGIFGQMINHREIGVIRRKTVSYEFFWFDRWFNVFRFHEPDGSLKCFYCNINCPPQFSHPNLEYVDLDLDLIVDPDFKYRIIDTDEFKQNSAKYNYPNELILQTGNALDELIRMVENRLFPFDYQINK